MPARIMLDESGEDCPECGHAETYVDKSTDEFHCAGCGLQVPVERVWDGEV